MDRIDITGLKVSTKIGVYAWEQQILQPLVIDISLFLDLSFCEDQLTHTVDYELLCKGVTEKVESSSFALIETVANNIAGFIKEQFSTNKVIVRVSKPHAIKNANNVSVTVER